MGWIVRVGFAFDFNVSLNGCAASEQQPRFVWYAFFVARLSEEPPVVMPLSLKIFLLEPDSGLSLVPSSYPLPQTNEDGIVDAFENALTHDVPVIIGPTPYFGVQPINQLGSRQTHASFNYLPDAVQEDFHILLGRLDEQLPIGIPAHILSEEIKALLHVRDDCLLGRKLKPSWSQKLLDEGLDFSFQ